MRINDLVLTLCIFQAWEAAAFVVPHTFFHGRILARERGPSHLASSSSATPNETQQGVASAAPADPAVSGGLQNVGGGTNAEFSVLPEFSDIWESGVTVQGGSLRTWSFTSAYVDRVQVLMKTEGRPLNANIELWQGPDNTPQKLAIYLEDGNKRPFSAVIETPGDSNSVAIFNMAQLEYPLEAVVEAEMDSTDSFGGLGSFGQQLADSTDPTIVQGGAIHTTTFEADVESVQILVKTDGRPLNAKVELLQGPNNNKQVMEIYTEDGLLRPFFSIVETPGVGNVVRVLNMGASEFPIISYVEPYRLSDAPKGGGGWDSRDGSMKVWERK